MLKASLAGSIVLFLSWSALADGEVSTPTPTPAPTPAPVPRKKLKLAITDVKINTPDLDAVVGESVSSVLAAELALRGADTYTVISRNELRAMVEQQAQAQQLGCDEPKCLADLAEAASADQVIGASIGKVGEEYIFTLELIDVGLGKTLRRQAVSWKGPAQGLVELCRPYVAKLLLGSDAEALKGGVEVVSNEAGADVHIDQKLTGKTPRQITSDLAIGRHRLRVLKKGYLPYETDLVVNPSETTLVQVHLIDEASLKPWYARWWFWTGTGTLLAGAVTLAYFLQPTPAEPTTTLNINVPVP